MNNRSLNEVATIILGAGISGLTLGYFLNKREKDFLIFEASKYIELLSQKINDTIKDKEYDHILFSYHGIPVSHLKISDPTNTHCYKTNNCCSVSSVAHKTCYKHQVTITTELVAKYLGLEKEKYSISFQSRLANEPWLKPYTDSELELSLIHI